MPQLADEGLYLASESTLYRLQRRYGLRGSKPISRRTHVTRAATLHRASGPNQVWSWDITWLPTTVRGLYLHLHLVMDVWSRRIVGWRIADGESADMAAELIAQACLDGRLDPRGLVLHSDNGAADARQHHDLDAAMARHHAFVLPPHVSDDNSYSEALFRTLKHTPAYPRLPFASIVSAQRWVDRFVHWYNGEHRHSAICYVTPVVLHPKAASP